MNSILEQLLAHAPVVTDGAIGTELQARGLANGECPDSWNLARPSEVEALARAYVEAGSEIVLTNTFRSNRLSLLPLGLADRLEEINRTAVEIARRAAQGRARVFASIGPSGKMLIMGEVTPEELSRAFAEQAGILTAAGVDGFVIETMTDVEEARVAVAAVKPFERPVVISFVFDSGKNKDCTMTGVTPERAAQELTEAGADVIGANCALGIDAYVPICRRLRASTDRPIWIKANAGLPQMVDGKVRYQTTPEAFASSVPALLAAGASFVGGCCGTNPNFVRAISGTVRRWRSENRSGH
jgi:methionine synthase I (cobalamin-dependent)